MVKEIIRVQAKPARPWKQQKQRGPMDNHKMQRALFFGSPWVLMIFVFSVTLAFSISLNPLLLSLPLLLAYYTSIWGFVFYYQRRFAGKDRVLKRSELRPAYSGLSLWMLIWTIGYPILVGGICLVAVMPRLAWYWIVAGFFFALVNGPSEEIFWRIFLERAGKDAGISQKTRLWYGSSVFGAWHFIFVLFLIPPQARALAMVTTLSSTFVAGLLWMMVYQKTGKMFPNIASHAALNFLVIFPTTAATMLGLMPLGG